MTDQEWESRQAVRQRESGTEAGQESISKDDFVDLMRLFYVILQRKRVVLGCLLFFVGMGVLYAWLATPVFSATSMLELHLRRSRIPGDQMALSGDELRSPAMMSDALNTEFQKLQSSIVREEVARELRRHADDFPELRSYSPEELVHMLANRVSFTRTPGTFLVEISVLHENRELAALIANQYADTAVSVVKASIRASTVQAVEWLSDQIDSYKQVLLESETRMMAFQRRHNIDGLQNSRLTAENALIDINSSLVQHQTHATTLRDMVRTLDDLESTPEMAGVLPSTVPRTEMIQQRMKAYIDGRTEEEALRARYTERHPLVLGQIQLNDTLRQELVMEIGRARETARANLELELAYVQSIEANKARQIELIDQILRLINEYNIEVLPLKSELDAANSSYRRLLQRIEQAQMAADEEASVITIYQYARIPQVPDTPRKGLIFLATLVIGLGGGIVLALLQHLYEDIVSTPYDIEVELKQNLMGLIPRVEEDPADNTPLSRLTLSNKFIPMTEAFAGLRAGLLVQGRRPRERGWVIGVMSVSPQEGKTTVSCNLAIALAKTFKRILLVDGDMRRPRHHDVFDIPEKNQRLMEVLMKPDAREADFKSLPQAGPIDNMQVVLGHPVAGVSPTEVLETETFGRFLDWARAHYDIIVVDSPPLDAASDALIYGRYADDCILVCRQNKSRKGALRQAIRELKKNGCPLVGVVVNDYQAPVFAYGRDYGGYGLNYGKYYGADETTGQGPQ